MAKNILVAHVPSLALQATSAPYPLLSSILGTPSPILKHLGLEGCEIQQPEPDLPYLGEGHLQGNSKDKSILSHVI